MAGSWRGWGGAASLCFCTVGEGGTPQHGAPLLVEGAPVCLCRHLELGQGRGGAIGWPQQDEQGPTFLEILGLKAA